MIESPLETRSPLREIMGNFAVLSAGEVIGKVLRFVATIHLAKTLGAVGFGLIGMGATVVGYFSLVVDAGLSQIGSREISREPGTAGRLLSQVLSIRGLLAVCAGLLFLGFIKIAPDHGDARTTLMLYGLMLFSGAMMLDWVFVPLGRSHTTAIASITISLGYSIGVLAFIQRPDQVAWVPFIQFAFEALVALSLFYFVARAGIRLRPKFRLQGSTELLKTAAPMGGSSAMRAISYSFDVVLIGLLLGYAAVGTYVAAYKVILLVVGFVGLYHQVFLPGLARALKEGSVQGRLLLRQSIGLNAAVIVPVAAAGVLLAPWIVRLFYGAGYAGAAAPMRVLLCSLVATTLNGTYKYALVAMDRQALYLKLAALSAAINISANLLLIRPYGLVGAASSTLLSEVVLLTALHIVVTRGGLSARGSEPPGVTAVMLSPEVAPNPAAQ